MAQRSSPPMQSDFSAGELWGRRSRVAAAIGSGVALLRGSPATGAFDLFRQNNDFYYLTGVEVPVAYLLIDGPTGESTLFLSPRDPRHEQSEGAQLSVEDQELITLRTGIEHVLPLARLPELLTRATTIHLPFSPAEGRQASRDTLLHAAKVNTADPLGYESGETWLRNRLNKLASSADLRDLSPVLDALRVIKSEPELVVMARAGRLCALAVREAMRATQPGVMEYQLAAVADYVYAVNGASGSGYRAIVAGGANIWNAHYYRNNCPLVAGDLVLMDYAPDVGNYTSDIGRMWPVNGVYSPLQRELYGFVVQFHMILLAVIRAGLTHAQIIAEAARRAEPLLASWNWSKPIHRSAAEKLLAFKGSLSHPVGMAVHDVGNYLTGPLVPGAVFALDPQMWIPEERLYIRVEDTVAVTETGVRNLTAAAPLTLDDVEREMRKPGLLAFLPPDAGSALEPQ